MRNDPQSGHITEHEFAEYLIGGDVSPELQKHIANCEICREELDMFSTAVGHFSNASLRWTEGLPPVSLRQTARDSARRSAYLRYAWGLSAAAALCVVIPVWTHAHPDLSASGQQVAEVKQTAVENSEAQIAEDNKLLMSVDIALSDTDPSPLRQFGMALDTERSGRMHTESRIE